MDILQNIYNSLLLEKKEKERVLEQIINNPKSYKTQLQEAAEILKEIAVTTISISQFESYLVKPDANQTQGAPQQQAQVPTPQPTISQPQAPVSPTLYPTNQR